MSKKPTYKETNGTTRAGDFLRKIGKGDFIEKGFTLLAQGAFGNWGGAVQTLLNKDPDVTPEQQARFDKEYELDLQDVADARAMQVRIATSKNSTTLSKNFVYYLSIGVFLFSAITVLLLFFIEIPDKNRDVINFILGVLVGTGLTGVFNYFLGSSKGSKDKLHHIINNK